MGAYACMGFLVSEVALSALQHTEPCPGACRLRKELMEAQSKLSESVQETSGSAEQISRLSSRMHSLTMHLNDSEHELFQLKVCRLLMWQHGTARLDSSCDLSVDYAFVMFQLHCCSPRLTAIGYCSR